jgi:DNA-binding transcriptional regulator YiaG
MTMNKVESLRQYIRRKHPDAEMSLSPPLNAGGIWSLDVDLANTHLAIEWSDATGFGISSKSFETFGETADEHIKSLKSVQKRIEELIATDGRTIPPLPVLLSRLREKQGLTQQGLAEKLEVRQATISGIERRGDIRLSTLQRVVEAMGGILEIYGSFPDSGERISLTSRPCNLADRKPNAEK